MLLYEVLIYEIVRHITCYRFANWSFSCTFPKGNRTIRLLLDFFQYQPTVVRELKLDPEAPTKISLTTTPEN
jgi:hypothetical protein